MAENMELVLRFYNDRYNMDRNYYEGYTDLRFCYIFKSFDELRSSWNTLLDMYAGDSYSIRTNTDGRLLCGGVFSPDDLELIRKELYGPKEVENEKKADSAQLVDDDYYTLDEIAGIAAKNKVSIEVRETKDKTTINVYPWFEPKF
jgi:hypothetical protein